MSWAEVLKVNDNLKKPINKQLRELSNSGMYVLTSTGAFTAEKSGWYKVIVVGASSISYYENEVGSAGGVGISTIKMNAGDEYTVYTTTEHSRFTNSSDVDIIAKNGKSVRYSEGGGGDCVGADYNYTGEDGQYFSNSAARRVDGKSVGAYIPELSEKYTASGIESSNYSLFSVSSGYGILGYGASAGILSYWNYNNSQLLGGTTDSKTGKGCVIIIPLDMEE